MKVNPKLGRTGRWWILALALAMGMLQAAAAAEYGEWRFEVKLDDSPIGYHKFDVRREGSVTTVQSEADFKVRFLFFTAYRYRHEYREVWDGNCLAELRSSTDDNGKPLAVYGGLSAGGFDISADQGRRRLESCVMSFAYWNPAILGQDALVNAQTGEYVPVTVRMSGEQPVSVDGQLVAARRFDLTAEDKQIAIWYGPAGEWLGLEAEVDGGRTLRYELAEWPTTASTWASIPSELAQEES